ncbi:unnamed protein product [Prunus armeniaca]|uniref:Uncharacterized protein n=1 Tax=Prunus armeniaca TaxID=36596 RepID=A0A6J5Y8I4_PRUAR|nr:unnamed protein product [Prunus armeniaca]CAB4320245.1 unnamed protein product [Prunus armeniaca]
MAKSVAAFRTIIALLIVLLFIASLGISANGRSHSSAVPVGVEAKQDMVRHLYQNQEL